MFTDSFPLFCRDNIPLKVDLVLEVIEWKSLMTSDDLDDMIGEDNGEFPTQCLEIDKSAVRIGMCHLVSHTTTSSRCGTPLPSLRETPVNPCFSAEIPEFRRNTTRSSGGKPKFRRIYPMSGAKRGKAGERPATSV